MPALFPEEERSKTALVFSILRSLIREFRSEHDDKLAFGGAFGYDLLFQFEPIPLRLPRETRKDLHLYLFDDIIYMDRQAEQIERYSWEFDFNGLTTRGLERTARTVAPWPKREPSPITSDHTPEEYMANVETVREGMRRGDYTKWFWRQRFAPPMRARPRSFRADAARQSESLRVPDPVRRGATGGRFTRDVRARGRRTRRNLPDLRHRAPHGRSHQDEKNIRALLSSTKEESELTMCTDVDRNDKSRVCEPGTVKVLERRMIEKYSGLFHTVDHVEGFLAEGFDSLDAFLSHMWAVTLIGAPKKAAANAIERLEKSERCW